MEIIQIVGFGLVAAFLALVLKEQKANFAFLITLMVGAGIFLFLIDKIGQVITMLQRLAVNANVNMVYVETLLKIIGIAYIAEFGAQITRDAGQGAIASKIELGGKILILVMAIPILTVIIETVLTLIPK
ncbi:stage III sporulation protein AD [Fictibacillus halophilus]|uniref:Stage III sporulation protein AD n=1 Tax=Fictibacillus arsenicus TaxID=255247 RepID=A0A1B1Z5Z0_9BACL|nr:MULTISPECIES: stage III sporulation protein AD [Fictibacillus]ANX12852.1 stage III sporulation protein AD [Fictibacillus arsenicus]MCM3730646.1 stage III sporulation protein AD [Fictibacillus nanhaiensis]RZT22414.1 stage III sporulation protein AD [Fictibacillus sp. BK138]